MFNVWWKNQSKCKFMILKYYWKIITRRCHLFFIDYATFKILTQVYK